MEAKITKSDIKYVKKGILIFQMLFNDEKTQIAIAEDKTIKIHPTKIGRYFKEFVNDGLVEINSKTKLYYVPVEKLIKKFGSEFNFFSKEEIEHIIRFINSKRHLIANAPLPTDSDLKEHIFELCEPIYFFWYILMLGFFQEPCKDELTAKFLLLLPVASKKREILDSPIGSLLGTSENQKLAEEGLKKGIETMLDSLIKKQ